MTAWATMLVPAGSVVVGAVIAGGAAVGGQVLTHRGSFAREREARRDAFKVARFEIERETLLKLQDGLIEHIEVVSNVLELTHAKQPQGLITSAKEDVIRSELKMSALTSLRQLSRSSRSP